MSDSPKSLHAFDPSIQTENIAFGQDELIKCKGCGRKNPPNRLKCLYCAHELEFQTADAASIKPFLRKLELWERGFNIILRGKTADIIIERAAHYLSLEPADLTHILDTGASLPLARVESEAEAVILKTGLEKQGLTCIVVSDVDLAAEKMPVRLSRIDILENSFALRDFNTGKLTEIGVDDLALIVPGLINSSRVDSLEKKRRKKESKMIEESATASDESLLDIYSRFDSTGFRINLAGFDFSCLGDDKGMLAAENLRRLTSVLKEKAPNAKLVFNYPALRYALGCVWEIESRKDSKGLVQTGFGKREFGAISSTNNLNQFTKYSRLQWHLL